jgi:hypothetical protein
MIPEIKIKEVKVNYYIVDWSEFNKFAFNNIELYHSLKEKCTNLDLSENDTLKFILYNFVKLYLDLVKNCQDLEQLRLNR